MNIWKTKKAIITIGDENITMSPLTLNQLSKSIKATWGAGPLTTLGSSTGPANTVKVDCDMCGNKMEITVWPGAAVPKNEDQHNICDRCERALSIEKDMNMMKRLENINNNIKNMEKWKDKRDSILAAEDL